MPFDTACDGRWAESVTKAAELIGWDSPKQARRGRGIALGIKSGPTTGLSYSLVRLLPKGGTVVEQRPAFDWIGMTAQLHALRPGQHETLRGYGREVMGTDQAPRYDDISSQAITHRYDLVAADPDKPYLPKIDPNSDFPNHYVQVGSTASQSAPCQDPVACIDPDTGFVKAGHGDHGRS